MVLSAVCELLYADDRILCKHRADIFLVDF